MNKPTYTVKRWCCTSGLCIECHARGNHGDKAKRQPVVQGSNLSKELALKYVANWKTYGAVMERETAQ